MRLIIAFQREKYENCLKCAETAESKRKMTLVKKKKTSFYQILTRTKGQEFDLVKCPSETKDFDCIRFDDNGQD